MKSSQPDDNSSSNAERAEELKRANADYIRSGAGNSNVVLKMDA